MLPCGIDKETLFKAVFSPYFLTTLFTSNIGVIIYFDVIFTKLRNSCKKKPILVDTRMGKIAMKKKIHRFISVSQIYKTNLNYENISFTFSKKLLSPFCGCGIKLSSSFILSKKSFCSFVNFLGVQTLICIKKSPFP